MDNERSIVGLPNIGNTCYMNAVLQALYACDRFHKYVMDTFTQIVVPGGKPSLHERFAILFLNMIEERNAKVLHELLTALRNTFRERSEEIATAFPDDTECDALEFLIRLLEHLGLEVNGRDEKMEEKMKSRASKKNEAKSAVQAWNIHLNTLLRKDRQLPIQNLPLILNKSIDDNEETAPVNQRLVYIFSGVYRYDSKCENHHIRQHWDVFQTVQLNIPSKEKTDEEFRHHYILDVNHCIAYAQQPESIVVDCDQQCEQKKADRTQSFDQMPPILVIQLNLFGHVKGITGQLVPKKIDKLKIVINEYIRINKDYYRLFASIRHHGDLIITGHYTITRRDGQNWVELNDPIITRCNVDTSLAERLYESYVVFYERCNESEFDGHSDFEHKQIEFLLKQKPFEIKELCPTLVSKCNICRNMTQQKKEKSHYTSSLQPPPKKIKKNDNRLQTTIERIKDTSNTETPTDTVNGLTCFSLQQIETMNENIRAVMERMRNLENCEMIAMKDNKELMKSLNQQKDSLKLIKDYCFGVKAELTDFYLSLLTGDGLQSNEQIKSTFEKYEALCKLNEKLTEMNEQFSKLQSNYLELIKNVEENTRSSKKRPRIDQKGRPPKAQCVTSGTQPHEPIPEERADSMVTSGGPQTGQSDDRQSDVQAYQPPNPLTLIQEALNLAVQWNWQLSEENRVELLEPTYGKVKANLQENFLATIIVSEPLRHVFETKFRRESERKRFKITTDIYFFRMCVMNRGNEMTRCDPNNHLEWYLSIENFIYELDDRQTTTDYFAERMTYLICDATGKLHAYYKDGGKPEDSMLIHSVIPHIRDNEFIIALIIREITEKMVGGRFWWCFGAEPINSGFEELVDIRASVFEWNKYNKYNGVRDFGIFLTKGARLVMHDRSGRTKENIGGTNKHICNTLFLENTFIAIEGILRIHSKSNKGFFETHKYFDDRNQPLIKNFKGIGNIILFLEPRGKQNQMNSYLLTMLWCLSIDTGQHQSRNAFLHIADKSDLTRITYTLWNDGLEYVMRQQNSKDWTNIINVWSNGEVVKPVPYILHTFGSTTPDFQPFHI